MAVYVFFNCDENKSEASMNIFYKNNSLIYKDTAVSRKKLFYKVQNERKVGRIKIADENIKTVESLILHGNPAEASNYITYGTIKKFDCI